MQSGAKAQTLGAGWGSVSAPAALVARLRLSLALQ